jgi:AbiU2
MSQEQLRACPMIPQEIRDLLESLRDDLVVLVTKWALHKELFGDAANAALLSRVAATFFQTIEESLRNDTVLAICRLGDPSRIFSRDAFSLAALVSKCDEIPNLEHRLTAFQSACGPVRRYRNRRLAHNDLAAVIRPRAELLPGIAAGQIDEIVRLAGQVLNAVYENFTGARIEFEPAHAAVARELIQRLQNAQDAR